MGGLIRHGLTVGGHTHPSPSSHLSALFLPQPRPVLPKRETAESKRTSPKISTRHMQNGRGKVEYKGKPKGQCSIPTLDRSRIYQVSPFSLPSLFHPTSSSSRRSCTRCFYSLAVCGLLSREEEKKKWEQGPGVYAVLLACVRVWETVRS
ncbi:hypothetical protein RRG08_046992 [Elysia crispata]|uniref:Uncharacterized protein n=1 Tax=Elysia crispata TaxID=231223 RepID=A0AAE1A8F1_9GAST|nr:hypothetical protein RRG08_046992 [Elysia crispata]